MKHINHRHSFIFLCLCVIDIVIISFLAIEFVTPLRCLKNKLITGSVYITEKIDICTLQILSGEQSANRRIRVYKDKYAVWINPGGDASTHIIKEADPATFRKITNLYFADKDSVFLEDHLLPEADPQTFIVLSNNYAKDHDSVYFWDTLILGAHAPSFEKLDNFYAKDIKQVYFSGNPIPGADPHTFIHVGHANSSLGKDRYRAYFEGTVITEVDIDTWNYLGGLSYSKDSYHVYYQHMVVPVEDISTVSYEDFDFLLDSKHVYFRYTIVEGIRPEEFEVLNAGGVYRVKNRDGYFLLEYVAPDRMKVVKGPRSKPY